MAQYKLTGSYANFTGVIGMVHFVEGKAEITEPEFVDMIKTVVGLEEVKKTSKPRKQNEEAT